MTEGLSVVGWQTTEMGRDQTNFRRGTDVEGIEEQDGRSAGIDSTELQHDDQLLEHIVAHERLQK